MTAAVPAMCFPTDVGCIAQGAAASAFAAVVTALGKGVVLMIKFMSTFWLSFPSPTVASGSGNSWSAAPVVAEMQGYLGPVTLVIASISFALAIGRIAFTGQGGEARHIVRQVAAVSAGSLAVVAVTQLLIQAGDAFSPWILAKASGGDPSSGIDTMIAAGFVPGSAGMAVGLWFFLFILCGLAGIVQCVFMVVRGAALVVLMVFVPPTAAGTASEEGWTRFKRLAFLIIGFALYKPVAAIVYAVGIRELSGHAAGDNDVQNAIYGLAIMTMAALALPAFIKFLMPMAAMGSSNVFSGATAAGVVAGGAAVVAGAGFGAGAAGASGATGAAGSTGGAGATGASAAAPAAPDGAAGGVGSSGDSGSSGAGSTGGGGAGGGGSSGGRRAAGGIAGSAQSGAESIGDADPEEAA